MSDRRRLERFKLSIPARLIVFSSRQKKEVFETSTTNICAGGAFFKTDHTVPEGSQVHLDFILPVNKLKKLIGVSSYIKINGNVVRSDSDGIAISFDESYELMPFRNL